MAKIWNVLSVKEYEVTENGEKVKKNKWSELGTAFLNTDKEGNLVNIGIELDSLPLDGKLMLLPRKQKDDQK